MGAERTLLKSIEKDGFLLEIFVEQSGVGADWLMDDWEPVDRNIGGITVQVPDNLQSVGCPKFYKCVADPLPALTSLLSQQSVKNPSQTAYLQLKNRLGNAITAQEISLVCLVSRANVYLAEEYGASFDFSWQYQDHTLENYLAKEILPEGEEDLVNDSMEVAEAKLAELLATCAYAPPEPAVGGTRCNSCSYWERDTQACNKIRWEDSSVAFPSEWFALRVNSSDDQGLEVGLVTDPLFSCWHHSSKGVTEPPEPAIGAIAEVTTEGLNVSWVRQENGKSAILYGCQMKEGLSHIEAAHEFGKCVAHSLNCAGLLEFLENNAEV